MESSLLNELNISAHDRNAHIPWLVLIVVAMFEFVIDYSRFLFLNKHVVFLLVLLICLVFLLVRKKYIIRHELTGLYIFILFCFGAMVINNLDFTYLMQWIALIAVLGMPTGVYQAEKIRKALVGFGIFMAITCIVQLLNPTIFYSIGRFLLNSSWEQIARNFASWNQYTGLSYQTGNTASIIAIAMAAYFSSTEPRKKKWLHLVVIAILYIGMALTSKRMMFIISLVIPVVTYMGKMMVKGEKVSKRIMTLIGVLLVAVFAFSIMLPYLEDVNVIRRFMSAGLDDLEYSSGRITLYEQAWSLFLANPILGIGWGNFSKIAGTSVHNVFLQLLAETGVFGCVLFVIVFISTFASTKRAVKASNGHDTVTQSVLLMCLGIQVIFFFDSLTGNPLYDLSMRTVYLFACSIGITMSKNLNYR